MDLSYLNDKQIEAVKQTEGPLLILAGAGSGKTSTMTHRIAYLMEQGVSPHNILAVTFTNKAAAEMRERVEKLVGSSVGMWIMTFHAFCIRILREDAETIGWGRNFVVYDSTDQKTVIKNIIKELSINPREYSAAYLLAVIRSAKEGGLSPKEFEVQSQDTEIRKKVFTSVYYAYEKKLRESNAMDFDDLILNGVKVFKRDEKVLRRYQDRFKYVMVDEYQDTNRLQYELVEMLAERHKNICVVGDDDQCIYEWRGADIRNILDFEKDFPNAKVIKLEQNYRSKANILNAAHSVISNNKDRKRKKLWTEADKGHKITYYRADDDRDEASFIAGEIKLLMEGDPNLRFSDFAILYRINAQSRQFEEALTRYDIPYRVLSGLRYYDRKEIKDIMSYMRLVTNPKDEVSFRRIINEPKRGMGDKTIDKLSALAISRGESMLETLEDPDTIEMLSAKSRDEVKSLVDLLKILREEKDNLTVSDIYDQLIIKTGYLEFLEKEDTIEAEGRIENLMEFKSVILDYENTDDEPSLDGFMEKLALMSDIDNHDENEDAVVLITMHSAKGLEFPVVFMPGMEDGLFPGTKAFEAMDAMEGERRLCYVGMTRAKERLFLTGATVRTMYGKTNYTRESQFMREVDKKLLEGDSVFQRKVDYGFGRVPGPGVDTGSYDGASSMDMANYNPYDAIKNAREIAINTGKVKGEDLDVGDMVTHKKFGEGEVLFLTASSVTVNFDSVGVKKLARGIAPIKKI